MQNSLTKRFLNVTEYDVYVIFIIFIEIRHYTLFVLFIALQIDRYFNSNEGEWT